MALTRPLLSPEADGAGTKHSPKKGLWDFVLWRVSGKHSSTRAAAPGTVQPPSAHQQLRQRLDWTRGIKRGGGWRGHMIKCILGLLF